MGLFKKVRLLFHDDLCPTCMESMEERGRQLYMLPMMVGHYESHESALYYKKNLRKVCRKADIPTGQYACGIIAYRCPNCGYRKVKVSVFLPVRDQEKYEDTIYFENGEMDDFLEF